jgi:hypothetical protein
MGDAREMTATRQQLIPNGIDGASGSIGAPLDVDAIARAIAAGPAAVDPRYLRDASDRAHYGIDFRLNLEDPVSAGWALIVSGEQPGVTGALEVLVRHRHGRILSYERGESVTKWLGRYGVEPGNILVERVPFYLLIAGGPEQIPFDFQIDLAVEYAVGRIAFDTPAEYERYADAVVAHERRGVPPAAREVAYFATRHAGDRATQMSEGLLVATLAEGTPDAPAIAADCGFGSINLRADDATKVHLLELFQRERPPAILFTATHGVRWPSGHDAQAAAQGALLCTAGATGLPAPADYVAAGDVSDDANVAGMIAFLFACYGAGTPRENRFFAWNGENAPAAPADFVSALPRRLLAHPNGPALAVIGHVDLAWTTGFVDTSGAPEVQPFRNALGMLLTGRPVGLALRDFADRYASLSTHIASAVDEARRAAAFRRQVPQVDADIAYRWVQRNDAGAYVVLGDPAVRCSGATG